jgi:hypothetical protein
VFLAAIISALSAETFIFIKAVYGHYCINSFYTKGILFASLFLRSSWLAPQHHGIDVYH